MWEKLTSKDLKGRGYPLAIGKYGYKDNPDDWKRASALAMQMEADLDHPEWEKLLDLTLAKYGLGGGKYAKLADVLQMPGTVQPEPEMTVGAMWEDYLIWKQGQVKQTTFKTAFRDYINALKGLVWSKATQSFSDTGNGAGNSPLTAAVADVVLAVPLADAGKKKFLLALNPHSAPLNWHIHGFSGIHSESSETIVIKNTPQSV